MKIQQYLLKRYKFRICRNLSRKNLVGKVDLVNTKDIQKASYLKMLQRVIDEML